MSSTHKKYDAFISYRHLPEDYKIASRLQELLEKTKVTDSETGNIRKLLVFRDESELSASENLSAEIVNALNSSNYLVLICSPDTQKSRWCMKEISDFRALHNETNEHILPLITDGDAKTVLPDVLRHQKMLYIDGQGNIASGEEEVDPLCADVRASNI